MFMFFKKLYQFGDRLEDKVRGRLSHYPLIYAFIGGAGVIIFWRGIWHTVDFLMDIFSNSPVDGVAWWDGPISTLFGMILLLMVGLFVSSFIGNEIVISGLKGEKKIVEKAEQEIKEEIEHEINVDTEIQTEMKDIARRLEKIQKILENKK